jgi:hypothetical protein
MSVHPEIQIHESLPQVGGDTLIRAYSGLLCLSENDQERRKVMDEFEETCPGALAFLYAVDEKERRDSRDAGQEVPRDDEFMPHAYGMLMLMLTFKHAGKLALLRSSVDGIFE